MGSDYFDTITAPATLSEAGGLVSERFVLAANYATEQYEACLGYLADIAAFSFYMPWTAQEIEDVLSPGLDGIVADKPVLPEITPIDIYIPTLDAEPPVMEDVETNIGDVPSFAPTDPNFQVPAKPTVTWPTLTDEPLPLSDVTIPAKPSYLTPATPVMSGVSIPSPPEFNMPTFEGIEPTIEYSEPPIAPEVSLPDIELTSPETPDITIPSPPELDLPIFAGVRPTMDTLTIPSPPEFSLPGFEGIEPSIDDFTVPVAPEASIPDL